MRVVIAGGGTGGHVMPALAIAEALRAAQPEVEPVVVGARRGVEADLFPRRSFRFHLLPAEPLYRSAWWKNARWLVLSWRLLAEGARVLRAEQPSVVVGTGGYAAAPVLFAAARRRVPIALQEQNAIPGLTTRWFASRARQVFLGFPEARDRLRVGRSTQVYALGNPITFPAAPLQPSAARAALGIPLEDPVVFAFGGSQGARRLNEVVAAAVERGMLNHVTLCWGTGAAEWERYRQWHAPPRRLVRAFWDPIAEAYAAADLAIARAGAMTTAELCAFGLPSILVPLPTAAADHQTRNALALEASGAAVHLPEADLTPESLVEQVRSVLESDPRRRDMSRAARQRGHPDAARRIAETILGLVS